MELSNFPLKNFEPYTSKTKKAIKKNTNLVEITHYVCQSIVFAELSGRPYKITVFEQCSNGFFCEVPSPI